MNLKCTYCNTLKLLRQRVGLNPARHRCPECNAAMEELKYDESTGLQKGANGTYWQIDYQKQICWQMEYVPVTEHRWVRKQLNYS